MCPTGIYSFSSSDTSHVNYLLILLSYDKNKTLGLIVDKTKYILMGREPLLSESVRIPEAITHVQT